MIRGRKPDTMDIEPGSERFNALGPKIQQKILKAREVAEERAQKAEDKDALDTWLRFETLRAIPIKERTQDERNEFDRLRRRMQKLEEERKGVVNQGMTEEEFWKLNRASASTTDISKWLARQEKFVLPTMDWMARVEAGTETPELCGENYVSLEEGVQDILDDTEEYGTTRLGNRFADEDIPADWSDGYFTGRAFYKDAQVFHALCAENEATKIYVSYGILTALPDWRVFEFLRRLSGSDTDSRLRDFYWSAKEAGKIIGWKSKSDSSPVARYRHPRQ